MLRRSSITICSRRNQWDLSKDSIIMAPRPNGSRRTALPRLENDLEDK
jgi:hypothetical protein